MEQLRGKSAKDKVVALRNELEDLRNELEEAQDDARDTQKRLEDANAQANAQVDQLQLQQDRDNNTNVTEQMRMLRTELLDTERDRDDVRAELREALAKIHRLERQQRQSETKDAQSKTTLEAATTAQQQQQKHCF